jgi:hypothetical protein
MSTRPFTFVHPSNILLAGPSGAGKTTFLVNALKRRIFHPMPTRIVWVYGESQGGHAELNALSARGLLPRIEFLQNDTNYEDLLEGFQPTEANMLVLDDQMNESKSHATAFSNLFVRGSHHRNITIVYMLQNVFEQKGANRTIGLNGQYLAMFKNPRDNRQIYVLASQMYPGNATFVRDAFKNATAEPHSYLLCDCRQETPEELRLLTNVCDDQVIVYVPTKTFTDI